MTTTRTTAAGTAATATEGATASNPHQRADGRPDHEAAAARTEELYREHGRLVGGLCRALLRDAAEGEDAAQQVFLAAHRALLNGTSPRDPAPWLATIARNECWARIRARMREPLPTGEIDDARSLSDPPAEALRNADLAALWAAIVTLPQQQRDALLLREFGGLSYEELAGALAVSGSAVESLLFRARQGVRTRLETAYAALTGASWLESLGRLAGGIGGGLAPVAAKVAAVSVGAAVATSGAVVTPRILGHSRAHTVHHAGKSPARRIAEPHTVVQAPAAVFVAQRATAVHRSSGKRRHGAPAGDGRVDGDVETGSSGKDGGRGDDAFPVEARATTESGARRGEPEGPAKESGETAGFSSDGHGSQAGSGDSSAAGESSHGGEVSTSGSGDGDSGHGGSGDGGSPDDGGVVATTANQVVTITVTTEDEPPATGAPAPGSDG